MPMRAAVLAVALVVAAVRPPPLANRTRQWALQTHHPPTRPIDNDYERDEEHYTNTRAGSRTGAVPTTHPSLVP